MRIGVILLLGLVFSGCKKEGLPLAWERLDLSTSDDFYGLTLDEAGHLYAAGGQRWVSGSIYQSTDAGNSWQKVVTSDKSFLDIQPTPSGVLATGLNPHLFWPDTQGAWQQTFTGYWKFHRSAAAFTPDRWLVGGGEAVIEGYLFILDPADTLDHYVEFTNRIHSVAVLNDQVALAVGYGIALRTDDGGISWQPLPITGDQYMQVTFTEGGAAFIVGYGGSMLRSYDEGKSWEVLRNGDALTVSGPSFNGVSFVNDLTGVAVGDGGVVWLTRDGGDSWTSLTGISKKVDLQTAVIAHEAIFVAGLNGHIYRAVLP